MRFRLDGPVMLCCIVILVSCDMRTFNTLVLTQRRTVILNEGRVRNSKIVVSLLAAKTGPVFLLVEPQYHS